MDETHSISHSTEYLEEKRLVTTLLTGVPRESSFFVAGITVLFVIFITLLFWLAPESIAELMPAAKRSVFQGHQWWRVFTATFIHSNLAHLLSNMLMLGVFSFFIYGYFGFAIFPGLSLLLAAAVNALTIMGYHPETSLLGASGLVYVLGGFWLTMYFFIQRQYPPGNRLIRVIGVGLMLFAPTTFVPTTSYTAHGLGFLLGVIAAIIYFFLNKKSIRRHEAYQVTVLQN